MATASTGGSLIGKIGSYLQIVAKDPSSTAFVPLAEAYRQIGLLDDALEAARLGTKMLPHFSPGFSTLGRILGQMGRIDEAMSVYAKALSIDRQSQTALIGLARLHLIRGERDQARKILKQAMEFHPGDDKIIDTLKALDLPRPWGIIKQATQIQQTATAKVVEPDETGTPIPTATLAEIYVKQGLPDKAVKVYEDILRQNPQNETANSRIQQLKAQSFKTDDMSTGEMPLTTETSSNVQDVVVEKLSSTPSEETAAEISNKSQDLSPMAVLQRWLSVIKQGRANVQ